MRKTFAVILVVSVMGSVAFGVDANTGFNGGEDSPAYTLGDINGQGSAVGDWEAGWNTTTANAFTVADGGQGGAGDQYLAMPVSASSSYKLYRPMDSWNGDFTMSFDVRFTGTIPSGGAGAPAQFQLENTTSGTTRFLHVKWEQLGTLTVNNTSLGARSYVAPTGDFLSFIGNWVSVRIECDWDAAGGPKFDLYSEKTDGSMGLWGTKVGFRDSSVNTSLMVEHFRVDAMKGPGWDWDNLDFAVVPEPGTMTLLGLGCLALALRKR